jgi:hypothetical protein
MGGSYGLAGSASSRAFLRVWGFSGPFAGQSCGSWQKIAAELPIFHLKRNGLIGKTTPFRL